MRIKELPADVVRKIAAGEVVTGCYSVVKELVENSIDANSSFIEIEIKSGGKEYIKVRDNGTGMEPDQTHLALKPHSTSKIFNIDDLETLSTFGFRGEALSTIAAVSRMTLSSRGEEKMGTTLEVSAGEVLSERPFFNPHGTSVEIFDLLFNTPARRKFLKSTAIEGRMVSEMVQRFILSFLNIDFLYVRDSQVVYDTRGTAGLEDRTMLVYPELSRRELIPLSESGEQIKIGGLLTLPTRTRRNRVGENVFVNGRYVRQFELNYALERGYGESLQKGNFPFAVLFVELEPSQIDVNIHPQKLEVKFASPAQVFETVKRAVRTAIKRVGSFTINVIDRENSAKKTEEKYRESDGLHERKYVREAGPLERTTKKVSQPVFGSYKQNTPFNIEKRYFRNFPQTISEEEREDKIRFLGVFAERYLMAESGEGLLLIDQHAAHERILYERLKEKSNLNSQKLLQPFELVFELGKKELIFSKKGRLLELGFDFELEDDKIVMVAIPQLLPAESAVETLEVLLDELRLEGLEDAEKVLDNLLAVIACKSAVRTGDKLDTGQARALLDELNERKLLVCPHGRPISMVIRQDDLDRYFSR